MSFTWSASGSFTLIVITFQSVSPSSISAIVPRILTCSTSPRRATRDPISSTSIGSLSPLQPVFASRWSGFSQVCGNAP
uniref:Putative secreted protein n=1 Tax=Anopheles triannulatus TaxID=58253 RepID=A0A2M4B1I7_9DIPT